MKLINELPIVLSLLLRFVKVISFTDSTNPKFPPELIRLFEDIRNDEKYELFYEHYKNPSLPLPLERSPLLWVCNSLLLWISNFFVSLIDVNLFISTSF